MKLFELENNKVTFHTEALLIKEFKDIWDRDKSKNKEIAVQEFAFILFSADYKSPYLFYDADFRDAKIIKDCIKLDKWKPDKLVEIAIEKYKELQNSTSMGLYRDALSAVDKVRGYFTSIDLTKMDKTGKPIYAAKDLIANLKNLSDVVTSLKRLEKEIEKELSDTMSVRGGGTLGRREMPKDKRK